MRAKLSDLFHIIGGGTPRTQNPEYWNGSIPWISVTDMGREFRYIDSTVKTITDKGLQESSTRLLQSDDLIISARGTVGIVNQIRRPMAFNQTCYGLRAKSEIVDCNYLYYLMICQVPRLLQISHGAVFNTITRESFDVIDIDLPPLETQKEIAHILGTLDDKIELNRRMNKNLEEIAQALFKHWFIDFEFPNEEGKPYKSSEGEMIDSEFGPIPKWWRVGIIGDLCSFEYGKALKSEDRKDGSIPVIGSNGQIGWHSEALVKGPGIVVGRKGNPGTVKWIHTDFFPIDTTFFVVPQKNNTPILAVYYILLNAGLSNLNSDSAVPGLNRQTAQRKPILISTSNQYNAMNELIKPLFWLYFQNHIELSIIEFIKNKFMFKTLSSSILDIIY